MSEKENNTSISELPIDTDDNDVKKAPMTDSDMPEPETAEYKVLYKFTPLFMQLFNKAVGEMEYSTILTNSNGEKIKLIDVVKFVDIKKNGITADELNVVIGFIAGAKFKYVHELMTIVEQPAKQYLLWVPVNN